MNTHPLFAGSSYARLLAVVLRALASFSVLISSLAPLVPVPVARAAEVVGEAASVSESAPLPDEMGAGTAVGEASLWELARSVPAMGDMRLSLLRWAWMARGFPEMGWLKPSLQGFLSLRAWRM